MASDTLPCGHPEKYRLVFNGWTSRKRCSICIREPSAVLAYAWELLGIRLLTGNTKSDKFRFIESIVDRPDDETPKLALADWLDEQGDERGELIRVECELGRNLAELRKCGRCDGEKSIINPSGRRQTCPHCGGIGLREPPSVMAAAMNSNHLVGLAARRAELRRRLGYDRAADECPACDGDGFYTSPCDNDREETCRRCGGTGKVSQ